MGPSAGLDGRKNLVPTGIRSRTDLIPNIHGKFASIPSPAILWPSYACVSSHVMSKFTKLVGLINVFSMIQDMKIKRVHNESKVSQIKQM